MHVNLYVELFMSLVIMVNAIEPTIHLPFVSIVHSSGGKFR